MEERAAPVLPLLILPGTSCDARLFDPVTTRLPPRPIVHAALDGGDHVADVADRVLAGAPASFALMGFSLGGIVALEIARCAPERVRGLALIGSNARAAPADPSTLPETAQEMTARLWHRYVAPAALNDQALRSAVDAMAAGCGADALARQRAIARSRPDSRDRLASLAMPALILAGEEDALCPPEMQREMAGRLPDAALVLLSGVGHFAPLEAPERVARHVTAWLDRVDARTDFAQATLSLALPPEVS